MPTNTTSILLTRSFEIFDSSIGIQMLLNLVGDPVEFNGFSLEKLSYFIYSLII